MGTLKKLGEGTGGWRGQQSTKVIRSINLTATKRQKDQDFFFNSSFKSGGPPRNDVARGAGEQKHVIGL